MATSSSFSVRGDRAVTMMQGMGGVRTDPHSSQPDCRGGEVDEALEVDGSPVVMGGEPSEVFEAVEAALDAVPEPVGNGVVGEPSRTSSSVYGLARARAADVEA